MLVAANEKKFTMNYLRSSNFLFSNFPEAHHVMDVTFQQSFRPTGTVEERKLFSVESISYTVLELKFR